MRRLEQLIDEARELTQNTQYDADSGISQKVFIANFNIAANGLHREITNSKSKWLIKEKLVDVVNGQEFYSWPNDLFLYDIDTMEWAQNNRDFIDLYRGITKDRFNNTVGYPYGYIPRTTGFILAPPLQSGTLRLTYIKQPYRLEKRSGKVSAVTVVGGQITAITIDPTETSFDPTYLNTFNYVCGVNKDGEQTVQAIAFDSINTTTGVFTLSAHTLLSGESIAVGSYIVGGKLSTNLPEFPTTAEDYLIKYVTYMQKYGDSSKWNESDKETLQNITRQIIDSFGQMTNDVVQVPIINADYLNIW